MLVLMKATMRSRLFKSIWFGFAEKVVIASALEHSAGPTYDLLYLNPTESEMNLVASYAQNQQVLLRLN